MHKFLEKVNMNRFLVDFYITVNIIIIFIVMKMGLHFCKLELCIVAVYVLFVVTVSYFTVGYFWSVFATFFSIVMYHYYSVEPYVQWKEMREDLIANYFFMTITNLIVAIIIGRLKEKRIQEHKRMLFMVGLNHLVEKLYQTNDIEEEKLEVLKYIYHTYKKDLIYIPIPEANGPFEYKIHMILGEESGKHVFWETEEIQCLKWVKEHKEKAGRYTDQFSKNQITYLPISFKEQFYGILGMKLEDYNLFCDENYEYFSLLLNHICIAIESYRLEIQQQKNTVRSEIDAFRIELMRSISHDFRSPLATILGLSNLLIEKERTITPESRKNLLGEINKEVEWLLRIMENILVLTKMNGVEQPIVKKDELVEEVIAEAINKVVRKYSKCEIDSSVPEEVCFVPMDAILIEQVLINLIDNAINHGKTTQHVEIKVKKKEQNVVFQVIDDGIGIEESKLKTLFADKELFNEIRIKPNEGLGIGLSICKAIIKAHGGEIHAKNRVEKGAMFYFMLPLKEV